MLESLPIVLQIIVALAALFGGGGVIYLVVNWYLNKTKNIAEGDAALLGNEEKQITNEEKHLTLAEKKRDEFTKLSSMISQMINERLDQQTKLLAAEQRAQNFEFLWKAEKEKTRENQETMQGVIREQGAAAEREKNCQRQLEALYQEIALLRKPELVESNLKEA